MSGPFATLTDSLTRVRARRSEARTRTRMRELTAGKVFAGLVHSPQAHEYGDFAAARAAIKGELIVDGHRARFTSLTPWDLELPSHRQHRALHRFDWLADMAALGGRRARSRAQGWASGWFDRFAEGTGPGWEPAVAGQRLKRLLLFLPFLEKDLAPDLARRLHDALPQHNAYLEATWEEETGDLGRAMALSGLLYGSICLRGFHPSISTALSGLEHLAAERVTAQGGIASRNPAQLLKLFRELLQVRGLLTDAHIGVPEPIEAAIARIAPTLRLLRHGDGTLARFHGGGRGIDGELDQALAEARVRTRPGRDPAMGFVRLHGGRVHLIVDCGRPPDHSPQGHASTLAFEMSSGRRPVLVNVGPALAHSQRFARAPRTTAAHNTLSLDRTSSSRLPPLRAAGRPELDALRGRPSLVTLAHAEDATGRWIQSRHDGYLEDYGLIHERRLFVGALGHQVHGEDVLLSPDPRARKRFLGRIKGAAKLGVEIAIHFHIHPEVEAELMRSINTVRLRLGSGETWLFRHDGGLMDLEASAYIDPALPEPVPSQQIVLRGRATSASAELSWSLVRETVEPRATRDVGDARAARDVGDARAARDLGVDATAQ